MNEKHKKLLIVSRRKNVADSICKDLFMIYGDKITVEYMLDEDAIVQEQIEYDAVLLTMWTNINKIRSKMKHPERVLVVERTLWIDKLIDLMGIPRNTKVLVVNDTNYQTQEMYTLLCDLKINDVTFIPYEQGKDYSSISIAVTPGEASYVPSYIKKIVDVGNRHLSITTFMKLNFILHLNDTNIETSMLKYMNMTADCNLSITSRYKEEIQRGIQMKNVMDGMSQGMMMTLANGEVVLHNKVIEQILNFDFQENVHGIYEFLGNNLAQKLLAPDFLLETFSICGREIIVSREKVEYEKDVFQYLFFFTDVTYVHTLENSARKRSKEQGFIAKYKCEDIIHKSDVISECIERLRIFAKSDKTVLIIGESGTGKELFAQSLHNLSERRNCPFVAVNCAALPENLLESELFGYEKGAFTGARREGKAGLFELACGGTLFLDEVGDMPLNLQTKLLRILQERQVMRIGGDLVINVDVRIVAATNQNLIKQMNGGGFRRDLYYRLSVLPLEIPALRYRREDIMSLFCYFANGDPGKPVRQDVEEALLNYDWPGNVRELENVAEYYQMMSRFSNCLPGYLTQNSSETSNEETFNIEYKILRELAESPDGSFGREKLKRNLPGISEYRLRKILTEMENQGLIKKNFGRRGTCITDIGRGKLD